MRYVRRHTKVVLESGGLFMLDEALVRPLTFLIVMIRWTGLAEIPFPGSLACRPAQLVRTPRL